MKTLFLLLSLFLSLPANADLYKCSAAAKTTYQDKPCQTAQIQTVIAQKPQPPQSAAILPTNSPTHALVERDAHGKIKRSEKAKADFKAANPCPANGKRAGSCPGYVIDHITPLACGGADSPENMQWQTVSDGKAKDSWERDNCQPTAKPAISSPDLPHYKNQMVRTGIRGGRYVLTETGKKRYLGRNKW